MTSTIDTVRAVLSSTPARWERLVATLPAALLERAPAPGEWSALACLRHLERAERELFPARVYACLTGTDFTDFDPNAAPDAAPAAAMGAALAAAFAAARTGSLDLLAGLSVSDLGRNARHPRLGAVTLSQLLHTWAGHDLMHTVQAERALLQPFIGGCGPWRSFFRDHEVG